MSLRKVRRKSLKGKKVLLTAGPTREYIDSVRFISNPSTGKMGFSLAKAAVKRKARVVLVSGPTNLEIPKGLKFVQVESACQMMAQAKKYFSWADIVIGAAAVSDYRADKVLKGKIVSGKKRLKVSLKPNPDILLELGKRKKNKVIVGFALQTNNLVRNAKRKLKRKNMNMIVANRLGKIGEGFESETNAVWIIDKFGNIKKTGKLKKSKIADLILDRCLELYSWTM